MRTGRALLVALAALGLVVAAVYLRERGVAGLGSWYPGCLFRKTTGFLCPGCGMTRAADATLRGELAMAFRYNPVGMVLLPLGLLGVGIELSGWVRGRAAPVRWLPGRWVSFLLAGLVLGFFILRNLPWWPFTYLAPP